MRERTEHEDKEKEREKNKEIEKGRKEIWRLKKTLRQSEELHKEAEKEWSESEHILRDMLARHMAQSKKCAQELQRTKAELSKVQRDMSVIKGERRVVSKMSIEELQELQGTLMDAMKNVQRSMKEAFETKYDCSICCSKPKSVVVIPCGHFLCRECVERVEQCPMCRGSIDNVVALK